MAKKRGTTLMDVPIGISTNRYVYQLMGVFNDRLDSCSTAAPYCQTGQNKGRYCEKALSFLLILLAVGYDIVAMPVSAAAVQPFLP